MERKNTGRVLQEGEWRIRTLISALPGAGYRRLTDETRSLDPKAPCHGRIPHYLGLVEDGTPDAGVSGARVDCRSPMRRRLLIIYKDPEFDERDEVILGQCEPFTSGWKLALVPPEGARETLLTGTYTDLRKIQESCAPLDDTDAVRQRVRDMRTLITSAVMETVAFRRNGSIHESTRVLPLGSAAVPEQLGGGLLEIKDKEGVLIAVLADPSRADDVATLDPNLRLLLEYRPRAIFLDLSRVPEPPTPLADELASFRDACQEVHVFFGICNATEAARKLLANANRSLDVFADSAAALAGIPGK